MVFCRKVVMMTKKFCCISQGTAFSVSYGFDNVGTENPPDGLQKILLRETHYLDLRAVVLAYPLSDRDWEEIMEERGVPVDYSNSYRWVQQFIPAGY